MVKVFSKAIESERYLNKLLMILIAAIGYSQLKRLNDKITRLESDKISREEYFQTLMNNVNKPIMPYMGQCNLNDYLTRANHV